MKKIILTVILISILACRTPDRVNAPAGLNMPVWVNDDILEITVTADADQAEKRKTIRLIKTRDDAVRKARYLLYDATLGASSGNFKKHLENMNNNPMAVVIDRTTEFPNGIIVDMKYDNNDRCTIHYRIHAIKLREVIKKIEEKYR